MESARSYLGRMADSFLLASGQRRQRHANTLVSVRVLHKSELPVAWNRSARSKLPHFLYAPLPKEPVCRHAIDRDASSVAYERGRLRAEVGEGEAAACRRLAWKQGSFPVILRAVTGLGVLQRHMPD